MSETHDINYQFDEIYNANFEDSVAKLKDTFTADAHKKGIEDILYADAHSAGSVDSNFDEEDYNKFLTNGLKRVSNLKGNQKFLLSTFYEKADKLGKEATSTQLFNQAMDIMEPEIGLGETNRNNLNAEILKRQAEKLERLKDKNQDSELKNPNESKRKEGKDRLLRTRNGLITKFLNKKTGNFRKERGELDDKFEEIHEYLNELRHRDYRLINIMRYCTKVERLVRANNIEDPKTAVETTVVFLEKHKEKENFPFLAAISVVFMSYVDSLLERLDRFYCDNNIFTCFKEFRFNFVLNFLNEEHDFTIFRKKEVEPTLQNLEEFATSLGLNELLGPAQKIIFLNQVDFAFGYREESVDSECSLEGLKRKIHYWNKIREKRKNIS